ncbi:MAG: hypothetical protein WBI40_13020, partial [Methylococcaceae bacterium]
MNSNNFFIKTVSNKYFLNFLGFTFFAIGYAILNSKLLIAKILYRFAAGDVTSFIINSEFFILQAFLLLVLVTFLPNKICKLLFVLIFLSGIANITCYELLGTYLDQSTLEWAFAEIHQFVPAIKECWKGIEVAILKMSFSLYLI